MTLTDEVRQLRKENRELIEEVISLKLRINRMIAKYNDLRNRYDRLNDKADYSSIPPIFNDIFKGKL